MKFAKKLKKKSLSRKGGGGPTDFIPYRDSMLTRLLSDSLGGTASTLMCCNLAPGSDHYFETLSSLEFAKRVKKVKNTVKLRTEALSSSGTSTGAPWVKMLALCVCVCARARVCSWR